jgi:hypothetical protein
MPSLQQMLLEDHHKKQVELVRSWVGTHAGRFAQLVAVVTGPDADLARRAAWPMSFVAEDHPALAIPHLPALVALLRKQPMHNAIPRNVLRLLQFTEIPESLHGEVLDHCLAYIQDLQEKAAIKAFSLTVLHRLSRIYPEILSEIRTIVAERMPYESPAFQVRARVFL